MEPEGCFLLLVIAALVGLWAYVLTSETRDHRRDRVLCERAGGVYVSGGVEYHGNTYYCIQPPVAVEVKP